MNCVKEENNIMNFKQIADIGIVDYGNLSRLAKLMHRAKKGEDIVVGFLGGSITMGSISSTPQSCYAYLVYEWWTKRFPDSTIKYVNAGIGATTSQFAVARVEDDLLSYQPDMITVEFSVNDTSSELFKETYEGLIRKVLSNSNEPAVMILNNVFYDSGVNAQDIHNQIGRSYKLPIVSIKDSIYPEVEAGRILCEDITPDNLHPNDKGHKLVSQVVGNFLDHIYEMVFEGKKDIVEYIMPRQTITKNRYIDSIRYQNKTISPQLNGFVADISVQKDITDVFKNGWSGRKKGDSICFTVYGSMISIQYKKTIQSIAPVALAIVDGDESNAVCLDANFEETWGDCIYLENILVDGVKKEHTLEIKIIEVDEKSDLEFYLISVIVADRT
jgi:lysophospholipase L1-like esterase